MYGIRFVEDDALPEGHDFVLVQSGGDVLMFYRESAVTPQNLEASWAAYRALVAQSPSLLKLVRTA